MATLREYFDFEPQGLGLSEDITFSSADGVSVGVAVCKLVTNVQANARFWAIYIGQMQPKFVDLINGILFPDFIRAGVTSSGVVAQMTIAPGVGYEPAESSEHSVNTKRIYFYIDIDLPKQDRINLIAHAANNGFYAVVRDRQYAQARSEAEKPVAFISHDSRDKDPFVRELALGMIRHGCPVWYDEFSLKVGDSLRRSIERGMKEASRLILVLSPNYFSNTGWGSAEFDTAYMREIIESNKNVILPVWHNVSAKDVYDYNARLSDKVGISSSKGVDEIARTLAQLIRNSGTR